MNDRNPLLGVIVMIFLVTAVAATPILLQQTVTNLNITDFEAAQIKGAV
jgi:hypothetical protein